MCLNYFLSSQKYKLITCVSALIHMVAPRKLVLFYTFKSLVIKNTGFNVGREESKQFPKQNMLNSLFRKFG